MESDLLIRDYERIRHILRDFYIFGCFTKDDYVNIKGISASKNDKDKKKINAYLPEDFINKKTQNKRVIQFCAYNMYKDRENYIANTFRCKTFTDLDIKSYFYVLQLLNKNGEMGLNELEKKINGIKYGAVNDYTKESIKNKLKELTYSGYITSDDDENKPKYNLKEDILKDLSDEEIKDICIMLELANNKETLQVPFLFLQKKL